MGAAIEVTRRVHGRLQKLRLLGNNHIITRVAKRKHEGEKGDEIKRKSSTAGEKSGMKSRTEIKEAREVGRSVKRKRNRGKGNKT